MINSYKDSNWLRVGRRISLEGCILETMDEVQEINFSYKPPTCIFSFLKCNIHWKIFAQMLVER